MITSIRQAVTYAMTCTISANHDTAKQLLAIAMRRVTGKANPKEVMREIERQLRAHDQKEASEQHDDTEDASDWDSYGRTK